MHHLDPREVTGESADLDRILEIAGMQPKWTNESAKVYMDAEAKKLKANGWYRLSEYLPDSWGKDPGYKLDELNRRWIYVSGVLGVLSAAFAIYWLYVGSSLHYTVGMAVLSLFGFGNCVHSMLINDAEIVYRIRVREPGHWVTMPYNEGYAMRYATEAVRERVSTLHTFLPEAQFELSVLFQKDWPFDPVLWLLSSDGDPTKRRPILVWDENGDFVSPH
jgi:hypothetical protein